MEKPLYRRVFTFLQNQLTTNPVYHEIPNIDEVVCSYGSIIATDAGDGASRWLPFTYNTNGSSDSAWYGSVVVGKTTIVFSLGPSLRGVVKKLYVIMLYTKTTD